MKTESITVVAGLGRCGSSLAMQMLRAGGMPIHSDTGELTAHETSDQMRLPDDYEWLDNCGGKAIKIIDPHIYQLPRCRYDFRFIWLYRDPLQQAMSQLKFMKACGQRLAVPDSVAVQKLRPAMVNESRLATQILESHGAPMQRLSFEDLINHTEICAGMIAKFLRPVPLDVTAMVAARIERHSDCLAEMLEQRLIEREPVAP